MILAFILFIAHRSASGFRNGMFYIVNRHPNADWLQLRFVSAAVMIAFVFLIFAFSPRSAIPEWLSFAPSWLQIGLMWGFVSASLISTALASAHNRLPGELRDLHMWTLGEQTFLAGGLLLASPTWEMVIMLACAVYPSVFLQKWLVNWSGGQPWHYNGTDDPTGRYYSIPLLGLKIPRYIGQKGRLILAIVSIFVFIINQK